jgi:hypothetical protein
MDLIQIGRLSFTLMADAVNGISTGCTLKAAAPAPVQLGSSTININLKRAVEEEVEPATVEASSSDSDSEVQFLCVVEPAVAASAAVSGNTAAAAGGGRFAAITTPQSAGAVNAPARSVNQHSKHRSIAGNGKNFSDSRSGSGVRASLDKCDKQSQQQLQQQQWCVRHAAAPSYSSTADSVKEHIHADSAQVALCDAEVDVDVDSDSSDVYESFKHYTRQPACAYRKQSSPTRVARALFSGCTAAAATALEPAGATLSDNAEHHADDSSTDDSMQVDSGVDHGDDGVHANDTAASADTASAAPAAALAVPAAAAVTVAVPADIVDLVSDSEDEQVDTNTSNIDSSYNRSSSSAVAATASVLAASCCSSNSGSSSSRSSSSAFSAQPKRNGKRKARSKAAQKPLAGAASLLEWCCKQCTLLNNGSDTVCAACGGSKPSLTRGALVRSSSASLNDGLCMSANAGTVVAAAAAVNTVGGWACDFCDTPNTAAATNCSECDYPPGVLSQAEQRSDQPVCNTAADSTSTQCDGDASTDSSSKHSSKSDKASLPPKTKKVSASSHTATS